MKKILPFALLFAFLFSSCDGFMSGAQTKEQLDRIIEYNNAPTYTITVNSDKGCGVIKSPAGGETQKKVTDTFSLAFEASADYEFIGWKIIDSVTKKEYPNNEYLSLESVEVDTTTCTFLKVPEEGVKLCLYAVVAKRPKVISCIPQWTAEGAYRDARIMVMFDHDMDENSIFFDSKTEIPELKKEYKLSDSDFIPSLDQGLNVYAYKKDGVIFYKNISIIHYVSGVSLLDYYDAPEFEDPRTLLIPAKMDKAPASGTQLLVTIGKDFCYRTSDKKAISLKEDNSWVYFVNTKTDTTPPEFPAATPPVIKNGDNTDITLASDLSDSAENPTMLYKGSFRLNITTYDNDSGPYGFFTLKMKGKDSSGNFTEDASIKIPYESVELKTATYDNIFVLPDYIKPNVYKITGISISDKNGRTYEQELNYYIDVDLNPPAITKYYAKPVEVKKTYGNGNSLNSYWISEFTYYFDTYDTDIDYAIIKIKEKEDNSDWDSISPDTVTEIIQGTATKSFVITTAQRGKKYNVWAEIYDTHGNSTVLPSNKNYVTAPNMITTATLQYPVEGSKGARITWEKPEGNYNGVCIRGYLKGKFISTKNDYYFYDEQEVCTCITPEIDPAAGRSIEIFTLIKDDDGNQYTSVNSKTLYLKVPAIGTTITPTSISIRDINNEGSIYKFYTKTSKSAEYVYYGQSQSSPEAYHLTNLTPGTTYYIKVDELDAQSEELVVSVELSATTKVDSPKNFNVVQQVDSDGKLMLHVTWDAAQGNFDGYKITVIPWNKTDNMFNGGSGKQFTVNVTDTTQTSYNIQRLSSGGIEHTIQAAYAYRIYMWTTNGNTTSELTDELYMCTLPANTSISINNSKTSLDVSCKFPPADSPFANASNTKETWLYFAGSEEALKASGNTNKLQLNPSLNSQSISTTTFSDFYDSDCYFAIKVILKFKYRTIETWSPVYVCHLDDVENVPIPPELLLYNGKLHDKYITNNSATLKWQTLQGNWDRVKIYLNNEDKISIENDGNEVKEYKFTSLNADTEYILSAAVEYNGLESEKSSVTVKTDMVYNGRNYQDSATRGSETGQIIVSFGPCQTLTNLPFNRVQMRYIKLDDDATEWCYLTDGKVSSSNGKTWTGGYAPDNSTIHTELITGLESGKTYVIKIDMIKWENGITVAASRTLTATAK